MYKRLIIISPNKLGGVNDYSNLLHKILSKYLKIYIFKVDKNNLAKTLKINFKKTDAVILQYSNYGYSKRGIPFWILKLLKNIKKRDALIITYFHEFNNIKPKLSNSGFWLNPFQNFIWKKILNLSNYTLTSCLEYKNIICKYKKKNTILLTCPTLIGENKSENIKKDNTITIFGLPQSRIKAFNHLNDEFLFNAKKKKFKIIDIGKKITNINFNHYKKFIDFKGYLNSKETSKILKKTKFGILCYNTRLLDKSSIYSTFINYNIIPIIIDIKKSYNQILKENINYLNFFTLNKLKANYSTIVKNNKHFYKKHNVKMHLNFYKKIINGKNIRK